MVSLSLKIKVGVGLAVLLAVPVLCVEKTTGTSMPLDPRFTADEPTPDAALVEHDPYAGPAAGLFSDLDPEDALVLSGVVVGELAVPVDMDLLTPDPTIEGGYAARGKLLMDGPGPFSLLVPKDLGLLLVQAFQDLESDGPTDDDPFSALTLEIGSQDLEDVEFALEIGAYADFSLSGASSATAFPDHEGEWTVLAGTLKSPLDSAVAVDFLGPDPSVPSGTKFLTKTQLESAGRYELAVPRGMGRVIVQFFQDQNGDGPDMTDPFAQVEVQVGDQERITLHVELEVGGYAAPGQGGEGAGGGPGPSQNIVDDLGDNPVTLRGTLTLVGVQADQVALGVYRVDSGGHGGRSFLKKLYISPGPFQFQAPAGFGELLLEASIDADGDGPTPGDPVGECDQNPIKVGEKDIDGLTIVVSK